MRHNPIFRQLIPRPRWPDPVSAAFLFLALVIGGTLWIVSRFQAALPSLQFVMLPTLGIASGAVALLSPALAALVTAIASGHAVTSESYPLLLLSTLTDRDILRGHLMAAIYRLRLLWVICFALLALLWVTIAYENRYYDCYYAYYLHPCQSLFPTLQNTLDGGLIVLAGMVFGIGFNALAINTALTLIFRTRRTLTAVIWSLVTVAIVIIALGGVLWAAVFLFKGYNNSTAWVVATDLAILSAAYLAHSTARFAIRSGIVNAV